MKREDLPKSIDDIEFIPFVGRKIDLNTKGKPSVYLRNVIIPYYRKVIRALEQDIAELRKSKGALLERKNKQIAAKRWLKYKSNQKSYAVQQKRVKEKASELLQSKIKKSAFDKSDILCSVYLFPVYTKVASEYGISLRELTYILFTSNFKFLILKDYKQFFGESFKAERLANCKKLGYIDVNKSSVINYYLSLKGREIIKTIKKQSELLKDE